MRGDRGSRGDGPFARGNRGPGGEAKGRSRGDDGVNRSRSGGNRGPFARDGRRHSGADIRRHGRRYSWGPGVTFWFYDGYYYGDCDWLRRRAVATGSRYWWQRYRLCRAYDW